jgi:hypothetical protein
MLFVVVERFRNGDAVPVYRRYREYGRLSPAGMTYVNSWVSTDLTTCYQVMEAASRGLLDEWLDRWKDLVEFEVIPVITSTEAAAMIAPRL